MEQYNWIKAYNVSQNDDCEHEIFVRQMFDGSEYFVDNDGCKFHVSELDFTRNTFEPQIISVEKTDGLKWNLDANVIADHKAKIDKREYWRKLRGDIALEIIRKRGDKEHYCMPSHFTTIADATRVLFDEIYEQDQKFFKNKYND